MAHWFRLCFSHVSVNFSQVSIYYIQVYAEFVYVQMYVVFIIFCSLQVGIDCVTDKSKVE